MKQEKMFTRGMVIGKSKGYQEILMLLRTLYNINSVGAFTAYELARMSGYSARHINRLMCQMYHDKKVSYVSIIRHGRDARGWYAKW